MNEKLLQQREQIMNIAKGIETMDRNLDEVDEIWRKLASPFAFLRKGKRYGVVFEEKFKKRPDWSGPMLKRQGYSSPVSLVASRNRTALVAALTFSGLFLQLYQESFFVLSGDELYFFQDVMHLGNERGVIDLRGASLSVSPKHKKFTIKVPHPSKRTHHFKLRDGKEFAGWVTMLTEKLQGDRSVYNEIVLPNADLKSENAHTCAAKEQTTLAELLRTHASFKPEEEGEVEPKDVEAQIDENIEQIDRYLDSLLSIASTQNLHLEAQAAMLERLNTDAEQTAHRVADNVAKMNRRIDR